MKFYYILVKLFSFGLKSTKKALEFRYGPLKAIKMINI